MRITAAIASHERDDHQQQRQRHDDRRPPMWADGGTAGDGVPDNYAWGAAANVNGFRFRGGDLLVRTSLFLCVGGLSSMAANSLKAL